MTIEWFEGFDTYPPNTGTDFAGNFWNSLITNTSSGRYISPSAARNGNYALRFISTISTNQTTSRAITTGAVRNTFGIAMRQNGTFPSVPAGPSFNGSIANIGIRYSNDQRISIYRAGTLIGASSSTYNIGTYNYCELEVGVGTGGTVTINLWVNNVLEFNDTISACGTFSQFRIGQMNTSGSVGAGSTSTDFDDIYIARDQDRLGDSAVIILSPNANATPQDWSVVGAASQYEAVANVPFDDAQYIESTTATEQSQFELANSPGSIFAVHAIANMYRAQKDDVQDVNVQGAIILPGSPDVVVTGSDNVLTQQWNYYVDVSEQNPDTVAPWTPADLDALELRFERTV